MANWRSAGHAVRRRMGAKSSHMDSLGSIGARVNIPTPEEALAGMALVGSPRVPMGNSVIENVQAVGARPALRGTLVPKQGAQAGDPGWATGIRQNIPQSESLGAAYRIGVGIPPMTDPSAGATQANGRIIPSSVSREDSWGDGITGAYTGY